MNTRPLKWEKKEENDHGIDIKSDNTVSHHQ